MLMARAVVSWVGATDDAMPPPRVRLRIFLAHGGICGLTGRAITPQDKWDLDHTIALTNGGRNEESNLRPVLRDAHQVKTAADVAEKAKVAAAAKKHLGIRTAPTKPIVSAPFAKSSKAAARAERGHKVSLPPRMWPGFVSAGEKEA